MAAASRAYGLAPSEIEGWVEDARKGMENALKTNPLDVRQQYEKQLKDLQDAYGEAMLELRARKNTRPCWASHSPPSVRGRWRARMTIDPEAP